MAGFKSGLSIEKGVKKYYLEHDSSDERSDTQVGAQARRFERAEKTNLLSIDRKMKERVSGEVKASFIIHLKRVANVWISVKEEARANISTVCGWNLN